MTHSPAGDGRGIHISGGSTFNGNAQTGDGSSATYVHHAGDTRGPAESPEVIRLREAVEELRRQLRDIGATDLPPAAADAAVSALDEVDEALPSTDEPVRGRVQRAIFTITGALASAASLTEAVTALRDAAAPWF